MIKKIALTFFLIFSLFNNFNYALADQLVQAPALIYGKAFSSSRIDLSWPAVGGVSTYKVYRNNVLIATVNNTTFYNDTGVLPNTSYTYSVSAFAESIESAGNPSTAVITPIATPVNTVAAPVNQPVVNQNQTVIPAPVIAVIPPTTPENFKVIASGKAKISLNWNQVDKTNVVYEIYRSREEDGKYDFLLDTESLNADDTDTYANSKYFYKIRACIKNVCSGFSNVISTPVTTAIKSLSTSQLAPLSVVGTAQSDCAEASGCFRTTGEVVNFKSEQQASSIEIPKEIVNAKLRASEGIMSYFRIENKNSKETTYRPGIDKDAKDLVGNMNNDLHTVAEFVSAIKARKKIDQLKPISVAVSERDLKTYPNYTLMTFPKIANKIIQSLSDKDIEFIIKEFKKQGIKTDRSDLENKIMFQVDDVLGKKYSNEFGLAHVDVAVYSSKDKNRGILCAIGCEGKTTFENSVVAVQSAPGLEKDSGIVAAAQVIDNLEDDAGNVLMQQGRGLNLQLSKITVNNDASIEKIDETQVNPFSLVSSAEDKQNSISYVNPENFNDFIFADNPIEGAFINYTFPLYRKTINNFKPIFDTVFGDVATAAGNFVSNLIDNYGPSDYQKKLSSSNPASAPVLKAPPPPPPPPAPKPHIETVTECYTTPVSCCKPGSCYICSSGLCGCCGCSGGNSYCSQREVEVWK